MISLERQESKNLRKIEISHRVRYEKVSSMVRNAGNINILDACCGIGYGSYILSLNENVNIIDSIDISEEAISKAKEYYNSPKINYRAMDISTYEYPEKFYDIITFFEAIEHLDNPDTTLNIFRNTLKPNGVMYLSTPCVQFNILQFPEHKRHYTQTQLCNILTSHGFEVIYTMYQDKGNPFFMKDGKYMFMKAVKL